MPNPTSSLPLFAPQVDVPDVRTPNASVAGSRTSEDAADLASSPFRRASYRKIMLVLAASDRPLSMAEIAERTGVLLNVVCLRLRVGELRPLWIQTHPGACRSAVKPSLAVDGFTLTEQGRHRVRGTSL